jgi:hypothetical protein
VLEIDGQEPGTVSHVLHGMGGRIPIVEISHQADRRGLGRVADKIDGAQGLLITRTHILNRTTLNIQILTPAATTSNGSAKW